MYQAPLEAWDAGERSQGAPQARHLLPCGGATLPTAYPGCVHAAGGQGPGRVPWRVGVGFAETLSLHSLGFRQRKGRGGAARGDDLEASVVREEAEPAPWNPACVRPALARGPATRACRSAVSEHRRCTGGSQRSAWRVSLSNTQQSFARKLSIGSLLVA